jgi:hypothetical protein
MSAGEDKPLNEEDFDGYGEEMAEMVDAVNQAVFDNRQLKEELDGVQGDIAQVSKNTLFDYLDKAIFDWETINKDPAFLNWLGQVDPLTGIRRQALLDDAYAALDSQRVASFFLTWKGGGNAHSESSSHQKPKITFAQYNKAVKDAQTGRITEQEFEKIANDYQMQFATGA